MRKIAYIIDSIGVGGGAEMLVADTVNHLDDFGALVITLYPYHQEYQVNSRVICLHLRSLFQVPVVGLRLFRILKSEKVDLIHCNLFWSSVIARVFKPRRTKLVVSLHSMLSKDIFKKGVLRRLETVLAGRQAAVIAVSQAVLKDYKSSIPYKGAAYVLHNFINQNYFKTPLPQYWVPGTILQCVAVGHFKPAKNYKYLLQAFAAMADWPMHLDIYGEGPDERWMQDYIVQHGLNVSIRGLKENLHDHLPHYHLFIGASAHEGYGIALGEAMASGLPCLVSDIPAFREVGGGACLYFDLDKAGSLNKMMEQIVQRKLSIKDKGQLARKRMQETASMDVYMEKLKSIYAEVLHS